MKAFVCDKCGKVILLEEDKVCYAKTNGIYHVISEGIVQHEIDLCEDCVQELMGAIRDMRGDKS